MTAAPRGRARPLLAPLGIDFGPVIPSGSLMKHDIHSLDTVNALLTEPSTAFSVHGRTDVAIIRVGGASEWAAELDRVAAGCLVLGFRSIVLDMANTEIGSSFQVACLGSAWHLLLDRGGTLAICGVSTPALERLQGLVDTRLFNIMDTMDAAIDWIDSGFPEDVQKSFPRTVTCSECGATGEVQGRGDHLCPSCGMTYLVTERGELLF